MKANFLKYIFILVIIATAGYAVYSLYFKDKDKPQESVYEETQEVESKNDLRLGISNYDNINPLISNNKEILNIDKLIFEPLFNITSDYRLEKCLATEWSKVSDTTYIVKMDTSKRWHNGSPVIAKDVQFTIDRLKEGNSVYSYNVEKVNSVEIVDGTTVKINLIEPVDHFEYNLTFPLLSNNYYLAESMYETTKFPIGTGMFKISAIEDSSIILKKNEKWWNIENQDSKIDTIEIKVFSEMGEVYNSFKLGNLDLVVSSNTNIEKYIGTIGYAKHEFKGRSFDYLAFNCQTSILQDASVRRAIAYALDKGNIVSSVYYNKYYISNFPLDYGSFFYTEPDSKIEYDLDNAKRALLDGGWQYKSSRWQKSDGSGTKRINTLTLTVSSGDANRLEVAENIKNQLSHLGIKVNVKKVSASAYVSILESKSYEMILTGVYNSYSPSLKYFFGENNLQNYYNEEILGLLNETSNTADDDVIKDKYNKIIEIYNNEVPFISLYRDKGLVANSQKLTGEITPNNYFSYYNLSTWARQ